MIVTNVKNNNLIISIDNNLLSDTRFICGLDYLRERYFIVREDYCNYKTMIIIDLKNRNITGDKALELLKRVGLDFLSLKEYTIDDIKILVNIMDLVLIDDEIEDNLNFIANQIKIYFGPKMIAV